MICGERLGMAIGHHPRRRLIRRALSGHHVGRDRPRRAAEADQRDLRIEFAAHAAQRLIDRLELAEVGLPRQRCDLLRRVQRIEPRAFAGLEPHRAAERVGNDQNIREDDRGIEVEAADRLQRDFGGVFRREAQIEKAAGLGAQFAIFRQIAAGLPHHPDRRHRLPVAGKHFEERFTAEFGSMLIPRVARHRSLIHCRCGLAKRDCPRMPSRCRGISSRTSKSAAGGGQLELTAACRLADRKSPRLERPDSWDVVSPRIPWPTNSIPRA